MRTIAAVLLPLVVAGCDLTATAEAETVCVREPLSSTPLPAHPAGAPAVPAIGVPVTVGLDLGPTIPADLDRNGVTLTLDARSISIVTAENADLSGIETAAVTVVRPGAPADTVVFRYSRPAGAAGVTEIRATPDRAVNLMDYLEDRRFLRLKDITLSGRAPPTPWTPAARTCAKAKVEVDELKAAGL